MIKIDKYWDIGKIIPNTKIHINDCQKSDDMGS